MQSRDTNDTIAHEMDSPDGTADITYGDERKAQETGQAEITITSKSETAMGKEREQINSFLFDKVFDATSGQKVVFEEISMLAQSVLDGYNVSFVDLSRGYRPIGREFKLMIIKRFVSSPMGRQGLGNLGLWKVVT